MNEISEASGMFGWIGTGHVILACWVVLMGVILINWHLAHTRKAGQKFDVAGMVLALVGARGQSEKHSSPLRRENRR